MTLAQLQDFLRQRVGALRHALYARFGPRARLTRVSPAPGVSYLMRLDTREEIQRVIYLFGSWDPEVAAHMVRALRPGDTFVDVGAHVGYFSLLAAQLVGREGAVHAFEPVPETAARFRTNLEANGGDFPQVHLHPVALADRTGEVGLYLWPGGQHCRDSMSGGEGRVELRVPAVRLDDSLDALGIDPARVRLVKMDVEGAELLALSGMRRLLEPADGPDFILELNVPCLAALGATPQALKGRFADAGYRIYDLRAGDRREISAADAPPQPVTNCLATKRTDL